MSIPAPDSAAPPSSPARARLLVLSAAVLWSSSGVLAKAPALAGWPGPAIAFWRALFACVVLVPLMRNIVWSWKFLLSGVLFALMNLTYLSALQKGSAANAVWLQNTAPVWVLLGGVFYFKEKAIRADWVQALLCALGIGLILFFESGGANLEAVGWGIASGVCYAAVILALRELRQWDSALLCALNHLFTVLLLSWTLPVYGKWPEGAQWVVLAGFGILQMGLPYLLFTRGLRSISGHQAAGIALLEPLLAPVWVWWMWGESPAWWTVAGGALILVGMLARLRVVG